MSVPHSASRVNDQYLISVGDASSLCLGFVFGGGLVLRLGSGGSSLATLVATGGCVLWRSEERGRWEGKREKSKREEGDRGRCGVREGR